MKENMLVTGEFYHVCTKSIAGYKIFTDEKEFDRLQKLILLARSTCVKVPLSELLKAAPKKKQALNIAMGSEGDRLVRIVAYCIMPSHLHLLLQQKQDHGISRFMNRILNSYTRFFNLRHGRKGPLWEKRFERIRIENQEHLLHETRYIHLNPVTAYLTEDPEDWVHTSYREFMRERRDGDALCEFLDIIDMPPQNYRKFVLADKENQRSLKKAKKQGRTISNRVGWKGSRC